MKKSELSFKDLQKQIEEREVDEFEIEDEHFREDNLLHILDRENFENIPVAYKMKFLNADGVYLLYLKDGLAKIPYCWSEEGLSYPEELLDIDNLKKVTEKDVTWLENAKNALETKLSVIDLAIKKQRLRHLTSVDIKK